MKGARRTGPAEPVRRLGWQVALAMMLLVGAGTMNAQADADRGAKAHEICLQCHGTELYVPPRRKIQSLSALRKEVERWSRSYNPKLSKAEIDDLVAYLDRDFYKFAK